MNIIMTEERMKRMAKRLRRVLRDLGVELKHTDCLKLSARLCGFDDWYQYLERDLDAPLGLLDHDLSEEDFIARDAFQMAVLQAAGLDAVARELLDRGNPTGSWLPLALREPAVEAVASNDPGRWSEEVPAG